MAARVDPPLTDPPNPATSSPPALDPQADPTPDAPPVSETARTSARGPREPDSESAQEGPSASPPLAETPRSEARARAEGLPEPAPGPSERLSEPSTPPRLPEPSVSLDTEAPEAKDLPKPEGTSFYDTLESRREPTAPPPAPDAPSPPAPASDPSRRFEVGAASSPSWTDRIRPLLATAAISALVTALVVGFVSRSRPEPERTGPEPWLQTEIDRRNTETRRLELDRRSRVIAADDDVLRTALDELMNANLRLEEQNALSIDQALDLDDKLEFFVERYRQVAEGERPGSDRRDAATALVEQGQRFRQALAGVLAALETESLESGQRARALRARLRDREIQGREIRVIHDPGRLDDARRVVELLSRAGARAVLVASEVESPSRNKGRLFYHGEQARDAARAIADLVGEIEYLQPEAVGLAQPFVSLWIVSDGLQSERLSGS